MKPQRILLAVVRLFAVLLLGLPAFAQGTAFTYQGQLNFNGGPANGQFDFTFAAYDTATVGTQQGVTLTAANTTVANGVFTVALDFGNIFTGARRWLAISVRLVGDKDFTLLNPRQEITPSPYAITAAGVKAGAITATMLGAGAVTTDKIAPGAVKPAQIDDVGAGAYQAFQETVDPLAAAPSLSFGQLATVTFPGPFGILPELRFTINGAVLGPVVGYTAIEEISRPYSIIVQGTIAAATTLNPNDRIGAEGVLQFVRNGKTTTFGGIITAFTFSSADDATRIFTARLEPALANLKYTTDYEVFQEVTVTEIADKLYKDRTGLELGHLHATYSKRENVIQYAESDFDFFNRILEDEGIFYFFNFGESQPALVLADEAAAYNDGPPAAIAFYGSQPTATIAGGTEYIKTFHRAARQSTASSAASSYNFKTPGTTGVSSSQGSAGIGEKYEFGSPLKTTASNLKVARTRQGRAEVERAIIKGSSNVPDLRAGAKFTLDDRTGSGLSGVYVIVSVQHGGFRRGAFYYGNEFEAIPASLVFRPALTTPKPKVEPSTAIVTGPPGETSHVDQFGRVKVQFHWDRHGVKDDRSSAWLRVVSPMAGAGRGMMFLPKVGDEVLVSFLQGDPNEPVVTGSLYNAQNVPPYQLPNFKAWSAISVGPPGGAHSEIIFDETTGSQDLTLRGANGLFLGAGGGEVAVESPMTIGHGSRLSRVASGQTLVGGSTTARTTVTIPFAPGFKGTPQIVITPTSGPGWDVPDTFVATVRSISNTSCVVNILRVDTAGGWSQDLRVNWIAWE